LDDRKKHRKGLVVEVLRIGDAVEAALTNYPNDTIDITLFDDSASIDKQFLYFKPARGIGTSQRPTSKDDLVKNMQWQKTFELAGRQCRVSLTPSSFYRNTQYQAWLALASALFLTLLLTLYLLKKLIYTNEVELWIHNQLITTEQLQTKIAEVNIANNERNKAQSALQSLNVKLEQRVIQRTQELQQKNDTLHQTLSRLNEAQSQLVEAEKWRR